jgi:hypothetical protein
MECHRCHHPLDPEYRFCPGCGIGLNVPVQVKKQHLRPYLTKQDRASLARASKTEAAWLEPYVRFDRLPAGQKIRALLLVNPINIPDNEVVAIARDARNVSDILRLAVARGRRSRLFRELRAVVEERIASRATTALLRRTYIREYIRFLHDHNLSIPDYINSITAAAVRSLAIEAYLPHITRPAQKTEWIGKITDPVVRRRVA